MSCTHDRGIVLGSVAISVVFAISADVLLYISVAIKASFLKFDKCNICTNNIAKMFLVFVFNKFKIFDLIVFKLLVKNLLCMESQQPLGGFSHNLTYRYI